MSVKLVYRPDIDGLRAVSVIAVILFHAGLGAPGGYVGVDVFFVISGFLITSLIVKELNQGHFSLARFWERRIRRIWPAATVTTIVALVAGFFLMLPSAFEQLAKDGFAQLLMVANIQFWRTSDYFAIDSDLRPLLHTWSLAVEEQFYIFYPPLLIVLWKLTRRWAVIALTGIFVASLSVSIWGATNAPMATFYLLPTRAWELMMGSLLAIGGLRTLSSFRIRSALMAGGLVLIAVPVFVYDNNTPFPGLAAFPPCLGAALVIYAGRDGAAGPIHRLLGSNPMRVLGLMSYSLYLWHWLILSFMRYTLGERLPFGPVLAALALTGGVSYVSWRFVENPIRRIRPEAGVRPVVVSAVAVTATILALCVGIGKTDGMPGRFSASVMRYADPEPASRDWMDDSTVGESPIAPIPMGDTAANDSSPCFLLWGDSHGGAISAVVHDEAQALGITGVAALRRSTPPLPEAWRPSRGRESLDMVRWNQQVYDWILKHRPANVILCARWSANVDGHPDGDGAPLLAPTNLTSTNRRIARQTVADGLQSLADTLAAEGIQLWLLKEIPYQPHTIHERVIGARLRGLEPDLKGVTVEEHASHQARADEAIASIQAPNVHVVDLAAAFFDDEGVSHVGSNGVTYYYDDNHVGVDGAKAMLTEPIQALLHGIESHCNDH